MNDVSWIFKNKAQIFPDGVSIANDQTRKQRDYYKKLKVELDKLNQDGIIKYKIKFSNRVPEIVEIKSAKK